MNTNPATCTPSASLFTNGGDYLTEGMAGRPQLSVGALTPAA